MRPNKTKIKRRGRGFEIIFSEKDGKYMANCINNENLIYDKSTKNKEKGDYKK